MKTAKPRQVDRLRVGDRFSRLVVIGEAFRVRLPKKPGQLLHCVVCECDCGAIVLSDITKLYNGNTRSCGCYQKDAVSVAAKTHGESKTRLYFTWIHMRVRCQNPKASWYRIYGGRGIRVCEEWDSSFESFRDWSMANGYEPHLSIDRIDNDGNYEPSNCRWTTVRRQANNRSNNVFVLAFGERKTLSEWAADSRCTVNRSTIEDRVRRGVDAETAITFPGVIQYRIEK